MYRHVQYLQQQSVLGTARITPLSLFYNSVRYRKHHNIKLRPNHHQIIRSRRHNIKGRIKKYNAWVWHLRGMSVDEALIQMRFARSPKSYEFFSLIKNGQSNAVHQFGLNPDNLVIHKLNAGRASQPKVLKHRGRDRHQFMKLRHSHLFLKLKEDKQKAVNSFRGLRGRERIIERIRPKNLIVID